MNRKKQTFEGVRRLVRHMLGARSAHASFQKHDGTLHILLSNLDSATRQRVLRAIHIYAAQNRAYYKYGEFGLI